MEIEAAPQPSFSCLMNGTSSQTPGGPIAPGREENGQGESGKSGSRFMANRLSGGHEDDDDHGGCQSDEDIRDFLIGKSTRGKVVLDFVSASG